MSALRSAAGSGNPADAGACPVDAVETGAALSDTWEIQSKGVKLSPELK